MSMIRTKITMGDGQVWYATSMQVKSTPERTIEYLNHLAKKQGLKSRYELASEEDYQKYRKSNGAQLAVPDLPPLARF